MQWAWHFRGLRRSERRGKGGPKKRANRAEMGLAASVLDLHVTWAYQVSRSAKAVRCTGAQTRPSLLSRTVMVRRYDSKIVAVPMGIWPFVLYVRQDWMKVSERHHHAWRADTPRSRLRTRGAPRPGPVGNGHSMCLA